MLPPPPLTVTSHQASNFDLLCACCAAHPTAERIAKIADWKIASIDWPEFLRQAEHHGVLALAARNLLGHATGLPPEIRHTLDSAYAANLRRSLWFAAELIRISRHLTQKEIRAIPYKGPALAQSAYGDLALRTFSDLDILISPSDFAPAKNALAEIAYHPSAPQTPAVERLWLRTGYERSFDGPAGKYLVELQWALLPSFYAVDPAHFGFDDLWPRTSRIALGTSDDSSIPSLSSGDSLLVLSLHAAKHLWTRLIWIADIAETLPTPNLDLAQVIARARASGIARILGVSLQLANLLLDVTIAPPAQALIASDPEIPKLSQECIARLQHNTTYDFESSAYFRHILRLREKPADRRRYLWRLLSTPGQKDVDVISLPEIFFPLYRVVRLSRLVKRVVGRLIRKQI